MLLEFCMSAVRSASEETMAVLEEVIMLAFQQCVYYITKVTVVKAKTQYDGLAGTD